MRYLLDYRHHRSGFARGAAERNLRRAPLPATRESNVKPPYRLAAAVAFVVTLTSLSGVALGVLCWNCPTNSACASVTNGCGAPPCSGTGRTVKNTSHPAYQCDKVPTGTGTNNECFQCAAGGTCLDKAGVEHAGNTFVCATTYDCVLSLGTCIYGPATDVNANNIICQ